MRMCSAAVTMETGLLIFCACVQIASIPAPLTRGPGNHRLRVGGFNSKFVSKTLCNLSINLLYYGHPRGWLSVKREKSPSQLYAHTRSTDLTEMASNKRLEASRLARAGRYWQKNAHHSTTVQKKTKSDFSTLERAWARAEQKYKPSQQN